MKGSEPDQWLTVYALLTSGTKGITTQITEFGLQFPFFANTMSQSNAFQTSHLDRIDRFTGVDSS